MACGTSAGQGETGRAAQYAAEQLPCRAAPLEDRGNLQDSPTKRTHDDPLTDERQLRRCSTTRGPLYSPGPGRTGARARPQGHVAAHAVACYGPSDASPHTGGAPHRTAGRVWPMDDQSG